ncbi:TetR/AcrR family transcriptional regulator [Sneathiella sp.]|uniref:TetR/AcrR family transcriptional regulator n=1 Tax=Sneathiella sp. TaxID=1964365 RepID=UPI0035677A0E
MTLNRDDTREQKRMAVLRTGARLFNEHGFDRTSLDDIASELNVSKRTLYYYVKNKDDILFECNRLAFEFMEETMVTSQNNDLSPLERIAMVMRSYMDLLSNEFGACLALSKDNILSEESRKTLRNGRRKLDRVVRELIEQGVADGTIAPCEPKLATAALFGAFNWVPQWQTNGNRETYSEIANGFLDIFLDGLRTRE